MKNFCQSPYPSLRMVIFSLILLILFSACQPSRATQPAAEILQASPEPIVINTFQDLQILLKEIDTAAPAVAQSRVDQLWQTLVDSKRVPLILGTQVVFLYRGEAEQVNWRGSFNGWGEPGVNGYRVGKTDLWVGTIEFPEASRAEYKIVLNGEDWIVDPANPHTAFSGLTGANNVVTLPGFRVTDESQKRSDVMSGTLIENLSIDSRTLGYQVNYWVYTPADYESLEMLPVIYVLDGNDFVDERMGALPNILDNMIAIRRIEPVLAVFIDAREPGNLSYNRREEEFLVHPIEHAQFIADELVPVIDRTYRTEPHPDARVIIGVSYGGLSATFIAASESDVFHNLAAFSPSFWVLDSPQYLASQEQQEGSSQMLPAMNAASECGDETDFSCPRLPIRIFMTTGLPAWDVGDLTSLVTNLEEQDYPVEYHQVREGHTWDNWRGLSDEMLTYFFASNQ